MGNIICHFCKKRVGVEVVVEQSVSRLICGDCKKKRDKESVYCDVCGATLSSGSAVGCLECYRYKNQVDNTLQGLQGKTRHIGKTPYTIGLSTDDAYRYYKERYEIAMKIRDVQAMAQWDLQMKYVVKRPAPQSDE